MPIKKTTYQFVAEIKKALFLLSFIFISCLLPAQNDDGNTDTIKLNKLSEVDTAVIVSPVPDEEVAYNDDQDKESEKKDDNEEPGYFSPKWMTGGPDSFYMRKLSDSAAGVLHDNNAFWYANKVFKKKEITQEGTSFFDSTIFKTILWLIIIGGFAAFLILYLSGSNVGLFRKNKMIATEESDAETDDIFTINYQKEIDKAIAAGNYRLAVRLMFLRVLRSLSDKNIIQFTQDKTNLDYLLQMHNTARYEGFFRLTRNYEYTWYGQFDIDREKFNTIRKDFDSFERQL